MRKPRVRTPKAEKMKTDEEGGMKEEGAVGRKRKKMLKVDVKETKEASGEADSLAQEVDPITAAINAVLANASALSTVVQKPKKMKRVRKQDQDGSAVGAQKRDAETTADDADENDDSSTAGNKENSQICTYCIRWLGYRFGSDWALCLKQANRTEDGWQQKSRSSSRSNTGSDPIFTEISSKSQDKLENLSCFMELLCRRKTCLLH